MATKRLSIGDGIRQAIGRAPMSLCGMARVTGIDKGQLSRFMAGKNGLGLGNIEILAELLDLHLVQGRPKQPAARIKAAARAAKAGKS